MLKAGLIAFGGGLLSAVASIAPVLGASGGVVFAYLAPLPLLMVGFGLGAAQALIAAASGIVVVAMVAGVAAAGVYGGMHALPSWLIVQQALRNGAGDQRAAASLAGTILCRLALIGAGLALAAAVALVGDDGVEASVRELLATAAAAAVPGLADVDRDTFVGLLAPLFIGMSGFTWLLMLVVNSTLAQGMLTRRGRALRPSPQWSALVLPEWMSWPLVATAVVALVSAGDVGYMARNLALIFAGPYFFLGLAVVHSLVRRTQRRGLLLATFYVTLALFFTFVGVAVAALGMIEQWAGVRRRLVGPGAGRGSE
ncbi:MAG: DUF2232 domain-containing protein [Rhodospirillales bacterium]